MTVLPLFPIPAPAGTPAWVAVLFGIAAITGFVVLIWQAVRYFRDHRDDE
jgi:hypothetical protein